MSSSLLALALLATMPWVGHSQQIEYTVDRDALAFAFEYSTTYEYSFGPAAIVDRYNEIISRPGYVSPSSSTTPPASSTDTFLRTYATHYIDMINRLQEDLIKRRESSIEGGYMTLSMEGNVLNAAGTKKLLELRKEVQRERVKTYCEIGFNSGFSALAALLSNPSVTVLAFDIGTHWYVTSSLDYLQKTFPGRITLILGDSMKSLPAFVSQFPNTKCDVTFIDGGHTYEEAQADLMNMGLISSGEGNVVILDDYFTTGYEDVKHVWKEAVSEGRVRETEIILNIKEGGIDYGGLAVGTYIEPVQYV